MYKYKECCQIPENQRAWTSNGTGPSRIQYLRCLECNTVYKYHYISTPNYTDQKEIHNNSWDIYMFGIERQEFDMG